jgi:hypothetical protein
MAKETKGQQRTVERVMHEYKAGELKSGPDGKGGKVESRRQAVAIALNEAGASNRKTPAKNRTSARKTKAKEAQGQTASQQSETKADLYAEAKKRNIEGRSKMSKRQLEHALGR